MAEVVNLRIARKRAERKEAESGAVKARLAHGASKRQHAKSEAETTKMNRTLNQHRIETGDRR